MNNNVLNVTELMTGKDGQLFCTIKDTSFFLAEVDTFTTNMNINSTQTQPVGSFLEYEVPTGVSFDLKFTEMVVRDDVTLEPILKAVAEGYLPTYDFRGVMNRPDGSTQSIAYNYCVPNGSMGLQSLTPGEIVKREQSFRVNSVPEIIQSLASKYMY